MNRLFSVLIRPTRTAIRDLFGRNQSAGRIGAALARHNPQQGLSREPGQSPSWIQRNRGPPHGDLDSGGGLSWVNISTFSNGLGFTTKTILTTKAPPLSRLPLQLPPFGRINRFCRTISALESRCPDHIPVDRWQQCVEDGRRFLATWGSQAQALGWTSADLFGLHTPPDKPHPSYRRLSRYDATGLVWLLDGRSVVALPADSASIRNPDTGSITTYRKHNKPTLGPLGDSLDDLK